ncbi:MAG: MATE family efflux transporter [Phycisphaerales bacterium]|nr:MATE family efflux transporter [Phycisphaerales bacterium]
MPHSAPDDPSSDSAAGVSYTVRPHAGGAPAGPVGTVPATAPLAGKRAALTALPAGPIPWQVLMLALPMLGELYFNFLIGFVDTFLAGRISKEANAAVGMATYASWLLTVLFTLVGTGAAAVVARTTGSGEHRARNRAVNQALLLAGAAGLATSLLAFICAPLLAQLLTQTVEARGLCERYLRIDAGGYALLSLTGIGSGLLRAAGDTRTPMRIMISVNIINAVVSIALVQGWFGPPLGATGIALGTLVARCYGGVAMIVVMLRGPCGFRVGGRLLRPHGPTLRRILRVGLPAAGDAAVMSATQLVFLWVVAHTATGAAATVNFAAHTIAMRMEALSFLPAIAWATAAATLAGQHLGAGAPELAQRSVRAAVRQGALICGAVGLGFVLFAEGIYTLMSADAEVRVVGTPAFRLLGLVQPVLGAAIIYNGALRGIGDARTTMVISFISGVGLRVPVGFACGIGLGWGLIGAWCGMWADNIGRFVLAWGRFRQGGWRHVRV